MVTPQNLNEWADKIDRRIGPISGREADALAALLRTSAETLARFEKDRADQDLALRDAIRETASIADELAFWRHQAIWGRAYLLQPRAKVASIEDGPVWKEALRQLEAARVAENRERYAHVQPAHEVGS